MGVAKTKLLYTCFPNDVQVMCHLILTVTFLACGPPSTPLKKVFKALTMTLLAAKTYVFKNLMVPKSHVGYKY